MALSIVFMAALATSASAADLAVDQQQEQKALARSLKFLETPSTVAKDGVSLVSMQQADVKARSEETAAAEFKELFKEMDADNSGFLEPGEIATLLHLGEVGNSFNWKTGDENQDGRWSLGEFMDVDLDVGGTERGSLEEQDATSQPPFDGTQPFEDEAAKDTAYKKTDAAQANLATAVGTLKIDQDAAETQAMETSNAEKALYDEEVKTAKQLKENADKTMAEIKDAKAKLNEDTKTTAEVMKTAVTKELENINTSVKAAMEGKAAADGSATTDNSGNPPTAPATTGNGNP